jgi:uncharacterized protein
MRLSSDDYHKVFRVWWKPGWYTVIGLLLVFSVVRFILVLQANMQGNYQLISYFFLAMIILPFLLLNSQGRKKIGIRPIESWKGIGWGMIFGILSCALLFGLMYLFFGNTESNAFT